MNRVFRTRIFSRWMHKSGLTDDVLCEAIFEMQLGLVDADLGGNVFKKRVALPGMGKRGSARVIVASRMEDCWFFLYGFCKNERTNIDQDELKAFQMMAKELLKLSDQQLKAALAVGEILEVIHGNQTSQESDTL